jgi:hypothetical protein
VFEVSRTAGKIEHSTYPVPVLKKNGSSDIKTTLIGFDITITKIHTAFTVEKNI